MTNRSDWYVEKVRQHQAREAWQDWMFRLLQRFSASTPYAAKVLDYGCGPGRFTSMLYARGYLAEGYDESPKMVQAAYEAYPKLRFRDHLDLLNPYDAICCTNVLGHIPDVYSTLEVMRLMLRDDGGLLVFNPNRIHTVLRKPVDAVIGYTPDPTLLHHWSLPEITTMIEAHGFKREWSYFDGYKFFGVRSNYAAFFRKV